MPWRAHPLSKGLSHSPAAPSIPSSAKDTAATCAAYNAGREEDVGYGEV